MDLVLLVCGLVTLTAGASVQLYLTSRDLRASRQEWRRVLEERQRRRVGGGGR